MPKNYGLLITIITTLSTILRKKVVGGSLKDINVEIIESRALYQASES